MRTRVVLVGLVGLVMFGTMVFAQDVLDDVHLFQNFYRDATITTAPYVDGGLSYSDYDGGSILGIGATGGYAVMPNLEVNAMLNFVNFSGEGYSESGLSDLLVAGRYNLVPGPTKISAGGYLTLPIGEEKVGYSKLNFGAFGAVRHPLANGMVVTGTLGLDFMETTKFEGGGVKFENGQYVFEQPKEVTEYENSLLIGAGVIYPQSDVLNIIGELVIKTEGDYMMLSGGGDYKLANGGRVRGALGIGLDDGAPDFALMGSYLFSF